MTDAACILVADDDKAIRTVLNQALSRLIRRQIDRHSIKFMAVD